MVLGNRVYIAYGTSSNGILQLVDRDKLLTGDPPPTPANLLFPQVARLDMPSFLAGHTACAVPAEHPPSEPNDPGGARMTRCVVTMVLFIALLAAPPAARPNGVGEQPPSAAQQPSTRFERFVLSGCSPCVKESHQVKKVAISPLTIPAFPRFKAGTRSRAGEIAFEVVRAWELGRAGRQLLAVRVALSVAAVQSNEFFRIAVGVLDAEEVGALADAVSEMAKAAAAALPDAGADSIDIDFRGGSLRVGVIRIRGDAVAYIQAGDVPTLALRPVWEVPGVTLYIPVSELPALTAAIAEVMAKMQRLRGS
jgi:hypothetical protein